MEGFEDSCEEGQPHDLKTFLLGAHFVLVSESHTPVNGFYHSELDAVAKTNIFQHCFLAVPDVMPAKTLQKPTFSIPAPGTHMRCGCAVASHAVTGFRA